jgi:hypothetical protein
LGYYGLLGSNPTLCDSIKRIEGSGRDLKRSSGVKNKGLVAQNPFRSVKRIFDHSGACFTANPKLVFQAQTLDLRPFPVRSRDLGNSPSRFDPIFTIFKERAER